MSKLWSLPVISVYLYAATILTQYGFNSYFNIPPNFMEASIKENIVYFFQLFQLASAVAGLMKLWMWAVVILAVLIITFFYSFSGYKKFIALCGTLLLGYLLYGSYNFGMLLAKNTAEFYVPVQNCASLEKDVTYIIPNFYQGKAILVPIDNARKMNGSILIKDLSELGCATERKYVGVVTR
jgi:hypothetical protein